MYGADQREEAQSTGQEGEHRALSNAVQGPSSHSTCWLPLKLLQLCHAVICVSVLSEHTKFTLFSSVIGAEVTLLPFLNFTLISYLEILQQSRTKGDQEDSNSTGTSEFFLTLILVQKLLLT